MLKNRKIIPVNQRTRTNMNNIPVIQQLPGAYRPASSIPYFTYSNKIYDQHSHSTDSAGLDYSLPAHTNAHCRVVSGYNNNLLYVIKLIGWPNNLCLVGAA